MRRCSTPLAKRNNAVFEDVAFRLPEIPRIIMFTLPASKLSLNPARSRYPPAMPGSQRSAPTSPALPLEKIRLAAQHHVQTRARQILG